MNKMKKLLSVLLAIVIALSCMSVTAFAAKAEYKTVDNLNKLNAYSPYGEVTRLSTEARMSIILDELDIILGKANINLGTLVNVDLWLTKLTLTVDLRSINALLGTVDEAYVLLEENTLVSIVKGALGILGDAELKSWEKGMTRESKDQLYIIGKLLNVLADNKGLVYDVLSTGELDLGLINSFIGGLDISVIGNIPGLIKPMIFGLFERWDDTLSEIKTLDTNAASASGGIESTLNTFVKNLFNNDMSITTVKYDKDGKMTSEHTKMPIFTAVPGEITNDSPRCYFYQTTINGKNALRAYHIVDAGEAKASEKTLEPLEAYTYVLEDGIYYLEQEVEGSETYVWKATDEWGNVTTLKWYNDESPLLPGFSGDSIDLSTMSAAELLYKFIPSVFENMAPVVLNGSVKKILAEFFGAQFTYVGLVGDDAVNALPDASNAFFTEEQGEYLWEWSNYAVINGNHYYRFEDQIYAGDISKTNNYFDIIDWGFKITGDFMNEFVPADGKGSESNTLLMNLNNFLIKVAETITHANIATKDEVSGFEKNWTRPTLTKGGNENLVANIKAAAQAVISLAPQHIFGSDYATNPRCYYNLLMSNNNQTILTGIAATLVDALMPQMLLPTKDDLGNTEVGAILAAVVRELATQLVPQNNYDALIYADYGTSTTDKVKTFLTGKGNAYWLDVCLVMGVDIGIKYLHNLADMGGDTAALKAIGWGIDKTWKAEEATIEATRGYWEAILNYVVDWGLGSELYQWKMSNLVAVDGNTVWEKLDDVFFGILPLDQILNVTLTDSTSKTEQVLRYDLILALLNLEWHKVTNLVRIPDESVVRKANVLDELALLIKGIVNGLFAKVGGGSYALLPAGMTDLDSLANQGNLATLARDLIGVLPTAFNNGLLDTALPFVNFFLGWTTNPQKYADPDVTFKNESDMPYLYTSGSTVTSTMTVRNSSSGMLYKHRNSSIVDSPYTITITKVESEDVAITASGDLNTPILPGAEGNINLSFAYPGEKAVMIKITYQFKGKDGTAIGGEQYKYVQQYTSNQKDDSTVMVAGGADKEAGSSFLGTLAKVKKDDHVRYMFVNNLGQIATFGYKFSNTGDKKNVYVATGTYSSNTAPAPFTMFPTSKWVHGSNEQSGLLPHGAMKNTESNDTNKQGSYTLFPYEYDSTSTAKYESGTKLNLPVLTYIGWRNDKNKSVAWSNDELIVDFYYYDTAIVEETYGECAYALKEDFANATDAQWSTFKAARDAAVNLIMGPKMAATFTTEYAKTNVEKVAADLEAAYDALVETNKDQTAGSAVGTTNLKPLTEALDRDEVYRNKGVEINFQDYDLYEYFVYGDLRTEARNVIASQEKPKVMDRYYIFGSGISEAELDKVIAAESNSFIAAGITASRLENKQEAIDASQKASKDYVIPTYSDLFMEDMASRLDFYRQFLQVNAKITQFLEKEIAYAKAQQYDSTKYTADTWAAYSTALDKAEKVVAGTYENADLMSVVFQAKWDLMTTQKQLLLKANSLIEQGGTATLKANIITAEAIFTSLAAGDGAWALAADYEGTAEEAYAQLISALGYYYTGEDGNEWNLYADSAYEYRDNDRPNKTGNQAKVDTANANLVAAIANFEAAAPAEPNTLVLNENAPFEAIIDLDNNIGGEYTGTVYGFDTLGWNDTFEADGTIADFLTTAYGDDYLEVIVPEDAGVETTGTIINVLDEEGNVVESYMFIYFGDLDKDGSVGASDSAVAIEYEMYYDGIETLDAFMAGDLDSDAMPGASDGAVMVEWEMYYAYLPYQSEVGANTYGNIVYEIY